MAVLARADPERITLRNLGSIPGRSQVVDPMEIPPAGLVRNPPTAHACRFGLQGLWPQESAAARFAPSQANPAALDSSWQQPAGAEEFYDRAQPYGLVIS